MDSTQSGQMPEADSEGASHSGQGSEQHQSSENNPSVGNGSGRGGESRTENLAIEDEESNENDIQGEDEADEADPSASRRDKGKGRYVSSTLDRDEVFAREIQAAEYSRMDELQNRPSSSLEQRTIEPRPNRFAPYTFREVASIASRLQRRTRREQAGSPSSLNPSAPFPWAASAAARGPLAHERDTEAILAIADAFLVRQPRINLFSAATDRVAYMMSLHAIFSMAIDIYRRAVPESSRSRIPALAQLMFLASVTRGDAGNRLHEPAAVAEASGSSSTGLPARTHAPVPTTTPANGSRAGVQGLLTTASVLINELGQASRYVTSVRLSSEETLPPLGSAAPPRQQQSVQEPGALRHESLYHTPTPAPSNPQPTIRWDMPQNEWRASVQEPPFSTVQHHRQTNLDSRQGPIPSSHPSEAFTSRLQSLRSPQRYPEAVYPVPYRIQRPPPPPLPTDSPQRPQRPIHPEAGSSLSAQRSSYSELVDPTPSSLYGSSRQWSPEPVNTEPSSSYSSSSFSQGPSAPWHAGHANVTLSSSVQDQGAPVQGYLQPTRLGMGPYPVQRSSASSHGYSESSSSSAQQYAGPTSTSSLVQSSSAQSAQWYPQATHLEPYPIRQTSARGDSRPVNPTPPRRSGGLESFYLRNPEPTFSTSSPSFSYAYYSSFAQGSSAPWPAHSPAFGNSAQPSFTAESSSSSWRSGAQPSEGQDHGESFSTPWYPRDPVPGALLYGVEGTVSGSQLTYSHPGTHGHNAGAYTMPVGDEVRGSAVGDSPGGAEIGSGHLQIFEMDGQDHGQDEDHEFLFLGESTPSEELLSDSDSQDRSQEPISSEEASGPTAASDRFASPGSSPSLTQELTRHVSSGGTSEISQEKHKEAEEDEEEGRGTASLSYSFDSDSESSDAAVHDASSTPPPLAHEASDPLPDQASPAQSVAIQQVPCTGSDDHNGTSSSSSSSSTDNSLLRDSNDTPANPSLLDVSDFSDKTSTTTTTTTTTAETCSSAGYHPDSPFSPDFSSPSPPPPPPSFRSPHPRTQQRWNARMIRSLADDLDGHLASGETSSSDGSTSRRRKRTGAPRRVSMRRTRVPEMSEEEEGEEDEPRPVMAQSSESIEISVSTQGVPPRGSSTADPSLSVLVVSEGDERDHFSQSQVIRTTSPPSATTPLLIPAGETVAASSVEAQASVVAEVAPAGPRRSLRIRVREAARAQQQQQQLEQLEQEQAMQEQSAQAPADNEHAANRSSSTSTSTSRRGKKRGGAAMTNSSTKRSRKV
ncbi:unnamed protein product [Mortierella alpina]